MSYDPSMTGTPGWAAIQSKPAIVTAFTSLSPTANQCLYFTGATALALFDLTAFARTILDDADAATVRGTLGLGSAAQQATSAFATAAHSHSASDITSGIISPDRLGSGTANSSTFLRGDGTYSAPTASVSGTTVEVNLGGTPMFAGKFTITDAAISGTSKVICWQAPGPYTGKGTRADEAEMQPITVVSVEPGSGSAVVKWQTPPYVTAGGTKGNALAMVTNQFPAQPLKRIGRVRGNIKFSYTVMS